VGLDEGFACSMGLFLRFDQGLGVRLEKQGLLKMVVYLVVELKCDSR
jgi:hypothetical protein